MSRAATGNWRGEAGRRSDRFDPVRLMLGSVAHTLAVVASFILSLLFFGFGCGMAAFLTVSLSIELSGGTIDAGPMARLWLSVALGITLGLLRWSLKFIIALNERMDQGTALDRPSSSPSRRRHGIWDHDLDGAPDQEHLRRKP